MAKPSIIQDTAGHLLAVNADGSLPATVTSGTVGITGSVAVTNTGLSNIPAVGQKASAASLPVVIANDQSAVPISGSVTATVSGTISTDTEAAAGSTTAPAKVGIIGGKTSDGTPQYQPLPLTNGGAALKVDGSAVTQPISGTVATNADTTIGGTSAPTKGLLLIGQTAASTPAYQPLPLSYDAHALQGNPRRQDGADRVYVQGDPTQRAGVEGMLALQGVAAQHPTMMPPSNPLYDNGPNIYLPGLQAYPPGNGTAQGRRGKYTAGWDSTLNGGWQNGMWSLPQVLWGIDSSQTISSTLNLGPYWVSGKQLALWLDVRSVTGAVSLHLEPVLPVPQQPGTQTWPFVLPLSQAPYANFFSNFTNGYFVAPSLGTGQSCITVGLWTPDNTIVKQGVTYVFVQSTLAPLVQLRLQLASGASVVMNATLLAGPV